MGLYQFMPPPSGRMGILWTLASVRDAALVEFGCMGHMVYAPGELYHAGLHQTSQLYSTHIDETDISLGGTQRLEKTVDEVILADNPRVVFLLPSSIPEVIGTDLTSEAEMLEQKFPDVRFLTFGAGGFSSSQHQGVGEALLQLVKRLPLDHVRTKLPTFNIIGSCADMYRFRADAAEIIRMINGAFKMKELCVLTSGSCVADIEGMGGAYINIVLRREGEAAAKHLEKRFGTPYVVGRPYGIDGTMHWLSKIASKSGLTPNQVFIDDESSEANKLISPVKWSIQNYGQQDAESLRLSIGAHPDIVKGILNFGVTELGLPRGSCWCESPDMTDASIPFFTEEQWMKAVQNTKGLLMTSGKALEWASRSTLLQISNPSARLHINPYQPPFMGFRGALHLADLWSQAFYERVKT